MQGEEESSSEGETKCVKLKMVVPEFGEAGDLVKILVVDDNSVNMTQLMGLL